KACGIPKPSATFRALPGCPLATATTSTRGWARNAGICTVLPKPVPMIPTLSVAAIGSSRSGLRGPGPARQGGQDLRPEIDGAPLPESGDVLEGAEVPGGRGGQRVDQPLGQEHAGVQSGALGGRGTPALQPLRPLLHLQGDHGTAAALRSPLVCQG